MSTSTHFYLCIILWMIFDFNMISLNENYSEFNIFPGVYSDTYCTENFLKRCKLFFKTRIPQRKKFYWEISSFFCGVRVLKNNLVHTEMLLVNEHFGISVIVYVIPELNSQIASAKAILTQSQDTNGHFRHLLQTFLWGLLHGIFFSMP